MYNRAVSEIVGYSLVFSLVIFSVAIVSVGGLAGYQSAEEFERQSNSQKAFDVLHNNLEDIYYQGAPSRGTEIDLGETSLALGDPIHINLTVTGTNNSQNFSIESQPLVQNLGDDNKLVYEAGAVFQTTRDGGIIRQRPPMVLRGNTTHLIVPNVKAANERSVGSGTVLIRAQSRGQEIRYRNTTQTAANLTINVTSPRRDLWYEYFTDRSAIKECDRPADKDNVVVCETVSLDQITLVESRLNIVFDR